MINQEDATRLQRIISRGAALFFGIMFAINLIEKPVPVSQFDFGMLMNAGLIGMDLILAIYSDKKKFAATGQLNSFISTAICLAVVVLNTGLYFYLVG